LLSREANETLIMLSEHDNRGHCPCTSWVLDDVPLTPQNWTMLVLVLKPRVWRAFESLRTKRTVVEGLRLSFIIIEDYYIPMLMQGMGRSI
jgi:hypothetical protein